MGGSCWCKLISCMFDWIFRISVKRKTFSLEEQSKKVWMECFWWIYVFAADKRAAPWRWSLYKAFRPGWLCVGSRSFVLESVSFMSFILSHFLKLSQFSSLIPPPLLPSLQKPLDLCFSSIENAFIGFSLSPSHLFSCSLSPPAEVRSDTVPGRGPERRADIAVESRRDQPGPGAAVCLHLRSFRPAAIHTVLAQRRRDEGPAAPGPAPGPGQPQRGGALALLPEDRPRLQQDAAAHQRWCRGPERVSVWGVSGRHRGRRRGRWMVGVFICLFLSLSPLSGGVLCLVTVRDLLWKTTVLIPSWP